MRTRTLRRDEKGQGLVEYVLILTVVVMAVGIMGVGFRKTLLGYWQVFTNDIVPACPGCQSTQPKRLSR